MSDNIKNQSEDIEKERNYKLEKENQYLLAKVNILTNNKNKGEQDEVLLLIELYYFNVIKQYDKLKVIFGEEASEGISILNMTTEDEILDINELSKANPEFKSDCKIKMKKTQTIYIISIKTKNGAPPTILNHKPRSAKIFQKGGILCDSLIWLDKIMIEYIDKRERKIVVEDTPITDLECLKEDPLLKDEFIAVLRYFVFYGSGKGKSKCEANSIMTYQDEKITFIKCVNDKDKNTYIKSIYDTLVLSLRDKNMPRIIPEYCNPWIFNDVKPSGLTKCKGSLHIRIK